MRNQLRAGVIGNYYLFYLRNQLTQYGRDNKKHHISIQVASPHVNKQKMGSDNLTVLVWFTKSASLAQLPSKLEGRPTSMETLDSARMRFIARSMESLYGEIKVLTSCFSLALTFIGTLDPDMFK